MQEANSRLSSERLHLAFYDVNRVDDPSFWAGTSVHIISHLRRQGHIVDVVGNNIPFLRRCLLALLYHYYRVVSSLHYHPDRHVLLTRLYSVVGSRKLQKYKAVDAILTVSAAFSAFLETSLPIFILLDATWGQIVETYPYFNAAKQPAHIVRGGFFLDNKAFNKSNVHLVMTSGWAADRAIADYGLSPSRVHILPFGANLIDDLSRHDLATAVTTRKGTHCNLLFVGREFDRKGGPMAISIAQELVNSGMKVTLHIVGCNPTALPSFAKSYGLLRKHVAAENRVLRELYQHSDFFLMPSRGEAQGIVFNEAAAYALPVVASDVGGVSAVVRQNEWGFLAPIEAEAAEYATWISAVFSDRRRYLEMAWAARADYDARLSGAAYARSLTALIKRTLVSLSSSN